MIYQIFAIAVKELKILCKDWEALALLFAMPMFFIVVMSFALEGVYGAGGKNHPIKLLVVNQDPGPQAKEAITDLRQLEGLTLIEEDKGFPLNIDKAEQLIRTRKYPLALVFREDFSDRIVQGSKASDEKRASLSLMVDPAMNQQMVAPLQGAIKGLLERRALLAQLPQRIKEASSRLPGSFFDLHPLAQEIQKQFEKRFSARDVMDKETEGVVIEIICPIGLECGRWPTVIEQNVPACAIFGVFFIVLTLASSFIQERNPLPVDLGTIRNSQVLDGLTQAQKDFMEKNGFVVLHSQEEQFSDIRDETAIRTGQPYFLTSDAAFHALHLTFEELLKNIEREYFRPQITAILKAVLEQVSADSVQAQGTPIESDMQQALAYLSVAMRLLDPASELPAGLDPDYADLVDRQVEQILAGGGKQEAALFPGYQEDFGAYQPSGHYAGDPDLARRVLEPHHNFSRQNEFDLF